MPDPAAPARATRADGGTACRRSTEDGRGNPVGAALAAAAPPQPPLGSPRAIPLAYRRAAEAAPPPSPTRSAVPARGRDRVYALSSFARRGSR